MTNREVAERAFRASNMRFPGETEARGKCLQKLEELFAAINYLEQEHPIRRVLEIGSATGGTFLAWSHVAVDTALLISIDVQQFDIDIELMTSYTKVGQGAKFVRADSRSDEAKQIADEYAQYDLLFIDGDHSEEFVRSDWATYSPMVRHGGLVGFHDILDGGPIGDLWSELTKKYYNVQFIQNENDGWGGIGFLRV